MLILAGVSINALVGDNGVLTQTQYASFLNEMAAVEEAVGLWKAGKTIETNGDETTAIPTNGMCSATALQDTERLIGEVGYYRVWSIYDTMPLIDIESAPDEFNSKFDVELVFYPAGVQDLYYLNNEAIGIKGNKTYLIDASNSMIYSMTGIGIKGTRVYSIAMAKAIMSGDMTTPSFAEADVSGNGSGEALAGNVTTEYVDASGNPVYKKPDGSFVDANGKPINASDVKDNKNSYNANGFKIIASMHSNNVFKLYNNGDLYGKGLKGIQLNTPKAEMDAISPYVWKEFKIPSQIGSYKKIYPTKAGIFLIDSNDNVWSIGNSYGLTDDQRVEYTGREWVKLDLGKDETGADYKADRLYGTACNVYIVTTNNSLLGTGTNQYGQLGIGDQKERTSFVKISNIPNPKSIQNIMGSNYNNEGGSTIIKCTDSEDNNHFYLSGTDVWGGLGFNIPHSIWSATFIEIFNGETGRGDNIANNIKDIITGFHENCILWFKNGDVYWTGWGVNYINGKWSIPKVVDIRWSHGLIVLKCENNGNIEYYAGNTRRNYNLGPDNFHADAAAVKPLDLSNIPDGVEIQDFDIYNDNAAYFLTNNGDLYGIGVKAVFGNKDDYTGWTESKVEKLTTIDGVDSFFSDKFDVIRQFHGTTFLCKNGKFYITCDTNLMYGDDILQKTWTKIASNVLDFDARNTAYITRDHNVYIAGGDSRQLGLGTISETEVAINNYTLITQTEIAGKARQVCQIDASTYIVTVDNELYAAGVVSNRNSEYGFHGWETKDESGNWIIENQTTYTKIRDNVSVFIPGDSYQSKAYLSTDGKLYVMGCYTPFVGQSEADYTKFTEITFPSAIGSVSNIRKWFTIDCWRSFIVGVDGKLYIAGTPYAGGFAKNGSAFEEYTYNIPSGEKIIDVASNFREYAIMITDSGKLLGYGSACYLGIDRTDSDIESNQLVQKGEIVGKRLQQIAAGPSWYLAVDDEGKVYGTGSNFYGVLGRWKGTGRATPNSRYRTAYVWVECPELEI